MMVARQAAAAQLEQFRAEMVAEAAKMRAAVERQVPNASVHHPVCSCFACCPAVCLISQSSAGGLFTFQSLR